VDGNAGQMLNPALFAITLSMVGTYVILKVCDAERYTSGKQDEIAGLDLSMHGEEGYNFDS
jgi:Amt family ammonium transporter